MLDFVLGTVKFYNKERRFGFIRPDDGSADLYFNLGGGRLPVENFLGEIEIDACGEDVRSLPEAGDRLVCYVSTIHTGGRGPYAFLWTFHGYLLNAQRIISERSNPYNPQCRAMSYSSAGYRTVWYGDLELLVDLAMRRPRPEFLDDSSIEYQCRRVEGWVRLEHPDIVAKGERWAAR